jgi:hypothetical protein
MPLDEVADQGGALQFVQQPLATPLLHHANDLVGQLPIVHPGLPEQPAHGFHEKALQITACGEDGVDDLFRCWHASVLFAKLAVLRIPDKRLVTRAMRADTDTARCQRRTHGNRCPRLRPGCLLLMV